MDPFDGSWHDNPMSMQEAQSGFDDSLSWFDLVDWESIELNTTVTNHLHNVDSNQNGMADLQTADQDTPAMLSPLSTDESQVDSLRSLSNDQASITPEEPSLSFNCDPETTPTIIHEHDSQIIGSHVQSRLIPRHQQEMARDNPAGTATRAIAYKADRVHKLISAFKNISNSKGKDDDADWVKQQGDSKIRSWCEETVEAIIARQAGNKPLCPSLSKRAVRNQQPNYESLDARFQAVLDFLQTEKRACKRFQRDLSWPKRLADDPVYERDEMVNNDEGNTARALRDKQKNQNNIAMLQGWKDVLAGKKLTREEVETFVRLAEYNVTSGRKGKRATPPTKSGSTDSSTLGSSKKRKLSAPILADTSQSALINAATTTPDNMQQDYEIKWPIIDAECNFGRVTPQQVANAASCGVPVDAYINFVRFQHGIPEIDWLAD